MDKHEEKYCGKCNTRFICKVGDIENCQCNTVKLSDESIEFLSTTNFDCLCKDCLLQVNQDVKVAGNYRFPTQKEMYIEGLHFYKEGEYWVFTPLYHLLRGYCCKNNCRHCVYGYALGLK